MDLGSQLKAIVGKRIRQTRVTGPMTNGQGRQDVASLPGMLSQNPAWPRQVRASHFQPEQVEQDKLTIGTAIVGSCFGGEDFDKVGRVDGYCLCTIQLSET